MSETIYNRRLSPADRMWVAINRLGRYNVEFVVEGHGEITREALQQAATIAAAANPGMRVRLKGTLGFTHWLDSGEAPRVKLVENSMWDGKSERKAEFLDRFLTSNYSPVADILLLPGDPVRIVFRALHGAVDGRGLTYWADEVFRVLRGEAPKGSISWLTDADFLRAHRDKVDYRPERHAWIPPLPLPSGHLPTPVTGYTWRRICLPGRRNKSLFILAEFLGRHARKIHKGPVCFTIPVDWRSLRGAPASTSNLTGFIELVYRAGDRPSDLARRMHRLIAQHADCYSVPMLWLGRWIPLRILTAAMRHFLPARFRPGKAFTTASIASMGDFDLDHYGCPDFQATRAYGLPALIGRMNVIISLNRNTTIITVAVPEPFNRDGQLDSLLEKLEKEMRVRAS